MIGVMMYHTVLTLTKSGLSQRDIASELHISATTVNKYCNMELPDGEIHCCRRAGSSEFAVAEEYILERLSVKPKLRASRLFREVMERYPGIKSKQRAFRTYVKRLREQMPKAPHRHFSIVETDPGKQVQVDMGEMRIDFYPTRTAKMYFTCFILSSSRYIFVHWQLSPYKTTDFIDAHRQAFIYFEGIPEECVYDQTKLVVIQEKYREVIFNLEFHQFANQTGFHPHVCEGYDPQSKGKVERNIEEIKQDFLYGRVFNDLQDVQNKSLLWLSKFNGRTHATTHLIPAEAWLSEKTMLKPIPGILIQHIPRKADKTGLISYLGNKYSVPQGYQERSVIVSEAEGGLVVNDPISYQVIASHPIPEGKGQIIKNSNHYRDYSLEYQVLLAHTLDLMSIYPHGEDIVLRVVSDNPKVARDQLNAICKLSGQHTENVWRKALPLIEKQEQLRATLIETILNSTERAIRLDKVSAAATLATISGSVIQRSLDDYMRTL